MNLAVLVFLFLLAVLNVSYWFWIESKFPHTNNLILTPTQNPPVSVVICSKNNLDELVILLDRLQDTILSPDDEIIVVNDHSINDLAYQGLSDKYDIIVTTPDVDIIGKKAAILHGIKAASHENILITDVDCLPRKGWKEAMLNAKQNSVLVLGYSPYIKTKTLLNYWIRFETFITAVQYLSYANRGLAYMGVGRNMLLTKSNYKTIGLSDLHPHIPSGDDDMLVQLAQSESVCISPHSYVDSIPHKSWSGYLSQKLRHYGISTKYPVSIKLLLSWYSISQIGVMLLTIACL